ncbi:MAG: DUF6160 family protein [Desulfosalsimonas sp.]
MKRLTAILVAGLFVLAPLSASAMEMMSDSNMKDVTGQAGVSIAIDDVVLYQESIADTTYWDTDGTLEAGEDYSVGDPPDEEYGVSISYNDNVQKLTTINAIVDDSNYSPADIEAMGFTDLNGDAVTDIGIEQGDVSALTIDVGVAETATEGKNFNLTGDPDAGEAEVAGVVIGLPTVEISQYSTADRKSISLHQDSGAGSGTETVNAGATFIDIEKSGTSKMAILGGTLEIVPH